jgi:hypothetical protein
VLLNCGTGTGKSLVEQMLWMVMGTRFHRSCPGGSGKFGMFLFSCDTLLERDRARYTSMAGTFDWFGKVEVKTREMF